MAWVFAGDGTRLFVEVRGDGPVTVLFTHGYAQSSVCWEHQLDALAAQGVRTVRWDLRDHGRSGRAPEGSWRIDVLADDLATVLRQTVPTGPVVLVGHSMGGMTMMALAERHPELLASRVARAAFLSTAATGARLAWLGLPGIGTLWAQALAGRVFGLLGPRRHGWWLVRATGPVGRAAVWLTCCGWRTSRADTVLTVAAARDAGFGAMEHFLPTLLAHDRRDALSAFTGMPVLVLNGGADLLIPSACSDEIADALPGCRRVRVPAAGHNIMLAAHQRCSDELLALARQAAVSGASGRLDR